MEATLAALRLLYQTDDPPDWFTLLSGVDYPIKTAERILADLTTMNADALIRHRLIDRQAPKHSFERTCLRRYHRRAWRMPKGASPHSLPQAFRLSWRISGPWLPFSKKFRCFAGSQFFTANARSAEHLLNASQQHCKLARHYATVPFPDESYFQCLLCNAPKLRVKNDNYRHIVWRNGGAHPKTLTCDDLPELNASHAHLRENSTSRWIPPCWTVWTECSCAELLKPPVRTSPERMQCLLCRAQTAADRLAGLTCNIAKHTIANHTAVPMPNSPTRPTHGKNR